MSILRQFLIGLAWWALLAASTNPALGQQRASKPPRGPALVEVTPVIERDVAEGQTFVGTVMPSQRAIVGSAVDGRVVEYLVEEGDRVEAGAPLARLLTDTIQLELEAAESELELRKQQQAELENGSRPDEVEQARARMEATTAAVTYLEAERTRLEKLISNRAISASEFERAVSMALEARQKYAESKAAYQLAVDGPRVEQIAQARAQTAMQDAIVRRLRDQISKHTIISRFAGYVTAEHTEVGQWVSRGDPVAEVVALDEVDVVAKVVESQVPYVQLGDSVRVEVPALPATLLTGTVAAIVPQADVRSRTFPIKVSVRNQITESGEPLLKAGMLARLTLRTGESRRAMLVPKDALVLQDKTPSVWVVDANSIEAAEGGMRQANASAVPVQLGVADGDLIQVRGPLRPGDLIVIKGNERIPPSRGPTGLVVPSPVQWVDSTALSAPDTISRKVGHGVN